MSNYRGWDGDIRKEDVVYAVQHPGTECIKIGKASDFTARFSALRSQYGALMALGTMRGYTEKELEVHRLLRDYSIPPAGNYRKVIDSPSDWFFPADEVKDFVRKNMLPHPTRPRLHRRTTIERPPNGELVLCWLQRNAGEPFTFFNHSNGLEWIAVYQVEDHNDRSVYKRIYAKTHWDTPHWFWHGDKFVIHVSNRYARWGNEAQNRDERAALELGWAA